jgi:hypothetical protein
MKQIKRKIKKQKAEKTEFLFSKFCLENNIECKKVDDPKNIQFKKQFLKKEEGKCPDFWCKKNGQEIFLEVKTLTNLTNKKREDLIDKEIEEIVNNKLHGGQSG